VSAILPLSFFLDLARPSGLHRVVDRALLLPLLSPRLPAVLTASPPPDRFSLFMQHVVRTIEREIIQTQSAELTESLKSLDWHSIEPQLAAHVFAEALLAANVMLCSVRFFKYLKLLKGMQLIWATLTSAVAEIVSFFVVFFTMFFGFMLCAYTVFGPNASSFSTLGSSTLSLLRMLLLSSGDYDVIAEANPNFAPIFFIVYMFLFYFLIIHVFIAIILDAWRLESELRAARLKEEGEADESANLVGDLRMYVEDLVRRVLLTPGAFLGSVVATLKGMFIVSAERKLFLSDSELLNRLQGWKAKARNADVMFLSPQLVKEALTGDVRNMRVIQDAQIDEIWSHINEKYYLTQQVKDLALAETGGQIIKPVVEQEAALSVLKRVFFGFKVMKDEQRKNLDELSRRVQNLNTLQDQVFRSITSVNLKVGEFAVTGS
jgi:hypothetical protein